MTHWGSLNSFRQFSVNRHNVREAVVTELWTYLHLAAAAFRRSKTSARQSAVSPGVDAAPAASASKEGTASASSPATQDQPQVDGQSSVEEENDGDDPLMLMPASRDILGELPVWAATKCLTSLSVGLFKDDPRAVYPSPLNENLLNVPVHASLEYQLRQAGWLPDWLTVLGESAVNFFVLSVGKRLWLNVLFAHGADGSIYGPNSGGLDNYSDMRMRYQEFPVEVIESINRTLKSLTASLAPADPKPLASSNSSSSSSSLPDLADGLSIGGSPGEGGGVTTISQVELVKETDRLNYLHLHRLKS
jgi:hypothetical protein